MTAILAVPEWREMYFRRLRTLVNEVLAPGRLGGALRREDRARRSRWLAGPRGLAVPDVADATTSQRTALFNAIQARRNAFTNDARVPGNQPAQPNIVINEIQHSPAGGDGAEFVELANPDATAIDISGWTISGGHHADDPAGHGDPAAGRR